MYIHRFFNTVIDFVEMADFHKNFFWCLSILFGILIKKLFFVKSGNFGPLRSKISTLYSTNVFLPDLLLKQSTELIEWLLGLPLFQLDPSDHNELNCK